MPGHYTLQIERDGFDTTQLTEITLNVGDNKSVIIRMKVGSKNETVTVDGSGLQINTTDASVSTVIDRKFVENIPLNGRSFQSLEALVPGTALVPSSGVGQSGEITVNGQRTEANNFTVDGVSVNTGVNGSNAAGSGGGFSGSTPGETALGTTQSLVSIDALEEFRATTSTYSAEYGRTPGGQFSFVTRSGTNDFHGSIYDYFRNDALDANNWFNDDTTPITPKTAERQNDFGGTFGGPVRIPKLYNGTDSTFFFFSYEGLRLTTPFAATVTNVPDLALRRNAPAGIQTILNSFPLPNGPELGSGLATYSNAYSSPSTLDSTSLRLDHNFRSGFHIFARYSYSPSSSVKRYPANLAELQTSTARTQPFTLGIDNSFGSNTNNELRANFTGIQGSLLYSFSPFGGATPFPINSLSGPGGGSLPPHWGMAVFLSFGGSASVNYRPLPVSQTQWNITDALTRRIGAHNLKAGVDWRRITTSPYPFTFLQQVIYTSESQVLSNIAASGSVQTSAAIPSRPIYTNLSLYVQDEWKITSRLSGSLGVRWELNPPPGDEYGNIPYTLDQTGNLSTSVLAPKGTPLWQTTHANFAPRLGIAYQAHQQRGHETVLRAGAGLFYDTGNTLGSQGISGVGYSATKSLTSVSFPLSNSQTTLPTPSIAAPYSGSVYAFGTSDRSLNLPFAVQWSAAVEQGLGENQTITFSYIGADGRRLLAESLLEPGTLGNHNFTSTGILYLVRNQAFSSYNSLQVQYKRQISKGLQALLSHTWSHSIDDRSGNSSTYEGLLRGNSDFDIRNNFQAAVTYDIPFSSSRSPLMFIARDWSWDTRLSARSSLPVDVISGYTVLPDGTYQYARADMVPGVAVYRNVIDAPGGRVININAFSPPTSGLLGNEPRNFLRGFAAWQADVALRRQFPLGEHTHLQFRAEAFNLFNHPNFGAIYNNLSSPSQFGYAYNTLNSQLGGLNTLYQMGGRVLCNWRSRFSSNPQPKSREQQKEGAVENDRSCISPFNCVFCDVGHHAGICFCGRCKI